MRDLILAILLTVNPCARQPTPQLEIVADAVDSAARTYEVKPLLLVSMNQHESGCRAYATSTFGKDIGLLQVRLKTAKTIDPSLTRRDLFDPYTNTLVATAYLTEKIHKCRSVSRALGAYSSGKCQVNDYSRKVMKTYLQLKKRYGALQSS
jgi:soluble lytic murein transglycosylase-like protein